MAIAQVTAGSRIVISDLNAYYNLLKGVTGSGETITLIYNAAPSLKIQPSSDPAASTDAIQINNNAGTVLGAITYDGKFEAANGTVSLPGLTFDDDTDTGLYRIGANNIGIAVGGVKQVDLTTTTATIVQPLTVSGASLSIGTTPATTGPVRIPNATVISARNSANSGNVSIVGVDGADAIQFGGTGVVGITINPGAATNDVNVSGPLLTTATTASRAGLRLPHGTVPTSPVNGDMWTTTAGLFVRINGATVGPLS